MNENHPLVSLITPGWNGKSFVHRLLDSIIKQTYRPIQYIYVDDCSTDGTLDVVSSYTEKFVSSGIDFLLVRRTKNGGLSEAIKDGLQHAKGDYFSCPEYDDVLLPESVAKRVEFLERHPSYGVVTADSWVVEENELDKRNRLLTRSNPNRYELNHFIQTLHFKTTFNAACNMIRMSAFDATHVSRSFVPSRLGPNVQILLPIYYHYNKGFIPEPLSLFVERASSLSHTRYLSYEAKVERTKEFERIMIATLKTIDMPAEDMDTFVLMSMVYFHKNDYIRFAFEFDKKQEFMESYQFLKQRGEVDADIQRLHDLMFNIRYRIKESVKHNIISLLNRIF